MFKVLNIFFDDMFFLVKEIMTSKIENVSSSLSEQFTTDSGLSFPWASTLFFQSDKQKTKYPTAISAVLLLTSRFPSDDFSHFCNTAVSPT